VLQPSDVDDPDGPSHLASIVDELIVVEEMDSLERMRFRLRWPLRTARRVLRHLAPLLSSRAVTARVHQQRYRDPDAICWPGTVRAAARAARAYRPDIVISEYAFFTKCFRGLPTSTLRVVDTNEVFSRNSDQFKTAALQPQIRWTTEHERTALCLADVVIAIQRTDANFLKQLLPSRRVITVGHAFESALERSNPPQRGVVLFVGSSNPYNRHGLELFIKHAWPRIRNSFPGATLRVVGGIPIDAFPECDGLDHLGPVDTEALVQCYRTAHVVINPQIVGTGLKIKCVEAITAGCAVVMNRTGAEGFEDGAGTAFLVADNWDEFAQHVITLLTDDAFRLQVEFTAKRFADTRFSPSTVFADLDSLLDSQTHIGTTPA
jgi:glycosyltransferase involved in cell wall biosynthesis